MNRLRPLMTTGPALALACALALAAPAGCKRGQPPREMPAVVAPTVPVVVSPPATTPAVTIKAGPQPVLFHVQVAATPQERANGLMGRPTLASDTGILFVFDRPENQTISTKENLLATDIIFIGADRRIVGVIAGSRPLGAVPYRIEAPSRYVLEIRGGLAAQQGFKIGQSVEFRAIPGT
jgi:uncharacterized protein